MSFTSSRARALFEAARQVPGSAPTAAQRAAMHSAIASATSATAASVAVGSASAGLGAKALIGVVVAAIAGTGAVVALRTPEPVAAPAPVVIAAAPALPVESVVEPATAPPEVVAPPRAPMRKRPVEVTQPTAEDAPVASPAPPVDDVRRQIDQLSAATAALDRHHFDEARALADAYLHEFPAGAVTVEARLVLVLAACGRGDEAAARAELAKLPPSVWRHPAARRLNGSCVGESK